MSETAPPYGVTLAGWYTLRYAGPAPAPPAWLILSARLDAPGLLLIVHLGRPQWLNAPEAELARAVPLPAGLELRYVRGEHADPALGV
jgi:hypothetical protein